MGVWSLLALLVCLLPVVIWRVEMLKARTRRPAPLVSPTPLRAVRALHTAEPAQLLAGGTERA